MPTKLEDIRPVLSVTDMEETVLFYAMFSALTA